MRVALLVEKYPPDPGGLGLSAQRLVRGLAAAGHAVLVLAPTARLAPGQTEQTDEAGVRVQRFGHAARADEVLADWFAALVAVHAAQPFDLVHGYFIHTAGFVAAYGARYLGLPSVVSARGNDLDKAIFEPGKAAHALYALAHAHAVTANARDLARKADALAPGRAVEVIPNGVDTAHFAPAPRDAALAAAFGLDERPVIGFVGEARVKKGLAPLLLAFRELAAQHPAQLALVGGVRSDDKDTLKVVRKQLPALAVRVIPYELEKDMPACYNLLDVLALPSLRDGLPNALLEGMACARAVVGTWAGGLPDALRDGENGRLVPPGDVPALTAALAALLADPAERARLGAAARLTVQQEFTPERELALNLALYQRLLAAPA
jgi:glycosyltransferase involved in cell wall biosynthesis